MPIDILLFADLAPALSGQEARALATLIAAASAATIAVVAASAAVLARRRCREHGGESAYDFSNVEWVSSDVVTEGMSVEVAAPTASGMRSAASVISVVQRRWIALTAPPPDDLGLTAGAPLEVRIRGESSLYRFHTTVRDRRAVRGVATLYVERPAQMERVQRRSHFRVDVRLAGVLSDLRPAAVTAAPLRGVVESLSGGGFRIALPAELPAGAPVRLRVSDEPLAGFAFEARVIRCDRIGLLGPLRYRTTCEFTHLPEETRNLIVAYCFEVQRAAMRPLGRPPGPE